MTTPVINQKGLPQNNNPTNPRPMTEAERFNNQLIQIQKNKKESPNTDKPAENTNVVNTETQNAAMIGIPAGILSTLLARFIPTAPNSSNFHADINKQTNITRELWEKTQTREHVKKMEPQVDSLISQWKKDYPQKNKLDEILERRRINIEIKNTFTNSDFYKSSRDAYIKNNLINDAEKSLQTKYLFSGQLVKAAGFAIFRRSPEFEQVKINHALNTAANEEGKRKGLNKKQVENLLHSNNTESIILRKSVINNHLENLKRQNPDRYEHIINNKNFRNYCRGMGLKPPLTTTQRVVFKVLENINKKIYNGIQNKLNIKNIPSLTQNISLPIEKPISPPPVVLPPPTALTTSQSNISQQNQNKINPPPSVVKNRLSPNADFSVFKNVSHGVTERTMQRLQLDTPKGLNFSKNSGGLFPHISNRLNLSPKLKNPLGKFKKNPTVAIFEFLIKRFGVQMIVQLIIVIIAFIADVIFTITQGAPNGSMGQ